MIVEILLNDMGTLGIISVFPMIYLQSLCAHKYVWIQYFKLLFKLDEQTTQWIIMIACLEFLFPLFLKKIVV